MEIELIVKVLELIGGIITGIIGTMLFITIGGGETVPKELFFKNRLKIVEENALDKNTGKTLTLYKLKAKYKCFGYWLTVAKSYNLDEINLWYNDRLQIDPVIKKKKVIRTEDSKLTIKKIK